MRVTVRLFAVARERAGRAEATLELPEPATVALLKQALAEEFPALAPLVSSVMIAVNAEYARDETLIFSNAEVAVIPPVSGGSYPPETTSTLIRKIAPSFRMD